MKARTVVYLVAAFTAVVLAFVGSTMVAQRAAREVRDLSLRISRDAAPGIETMATVRSEVRRIEALVRGEDERPGKDIEAEIADARQKLDRAQLRFQALPPMSDARSEEHTSELQSRFDLVCRLLLEKKKHSPLHQHLVHVLLILTHQDNQDAELLYRRQLPLHVERVHPIATQ